MSKDKAFGKIYGPIALGTWGEDDLRRAFVAGAAWWEFTKNGGTMWQEDKVYAENEADRRYPAGKAQGYGVEESRQRMTQLENDALELIEWIIHRTDTLLSVADEDVEEESIQWLRAYNQKYADSKKHEEKE